MKKLFAAIAAVTAFVGAPALGADMLLKAPAAAPPPAPSAGQASISAASPVAQEPVPCPTRTRPILGLSDHFRLARLSRGAILARVRVSRLAVSRATA
jgi:hypothetical protein